MGGNVKNHPEKIKILKEVIKILKQHGATLEEEPGDICYRRGHKKRNGKMCWHRGGKSDSPRCLWYYEEEASKRPGMLEQVKTLLSRKHPVTLKSEGKPAPSESREQLAPTVSEK
jgi:hypothetical protein